MRTNKIIIDNMGNILRQSVGFLVAMFTMTGTELLAGTVRIGLKQQTDR